MEVQMRKLITLFLLICAIIGGAYYMLYKDIHSLDIALDGTVDELPKIKSNQASKELEPLLEGDIFDQLKQSTSVLEETFGVPTRKDLTPYGYTWWVYTDGQTN